MKQEHTRYLPAAVRLADLSAWELTQPAAPSSSAAAADVFVHTLAAAYAGVEAALDWFVPELCWRDLFLEEFVQPPH